MNYINLAILQIDKMVFQNAQNFILPSLGATQKNDYSTK